VCDESSLRWAGEGFRSRGPSPPVCDATLPYRVGRARPGASCLTAQAKTILAVDFVAGDTVMLPQISALIAVEHGCWRAHLLAVTAHLTGAWTTQTWVGAETGHPPR